MDVAPGHVAGLVGEAGAEARADAHARGELLFALDLDAQEQARVAVHGRERRAVAQQRGEATVDHIDGLGLGPDLGAVLGGVVQPKVIERLPVTDGGRRSERLPWNVRWPRRPGRTEAGTEPADR
ncbi:MAG: hypothetical protein R3F60_13200 [bacterium]